MAHASRSKRALNELVPWIYVLFAVGMAGSTVFAAATERLGFYSPAVLYAAYFALERAAGKQRRVASALAELAGAGASRLRLPPAPPAVPIAATPKPERTPVEPGLTIAEPPAAAAT